MSDFHLQRIFCEVKDGVTSYNRIRRVGDPYWLEPCNCYTEMPYPLLRFYERAFYHASGWEAKLVGLSSGNAEMKKKKESYAMLLERPKENVSAELHNQLIHLRQEVDTENITIIRTPGRYIIRVFSPISDENLALLLLTLTEDFDAVDKKYTAIDTWRKWSLHHSYPDAFRPGFWQKEPGASRIKIRFLNPSATSISQQSGWGTCGFPDMQSRTELTVAIAQQAVMALFDNNAFTFSRYLAENLEYQSLIAAENKDTLPWRNLVYRVLNDVFPGYWDIIENLENVAFTVEVPHADCL